MDLFSFIKSNVDIIAVVSEYTNLKKMGALYWKAPCPFHHEKTPSFTVSPHKNIFYCFGCHVTGDVINFIEKIEHVGPFEAAELLASKYNLDIPEEYKHKKTDKKNEKTYFQLCYYVATWCNTMLEQNSGAKQYLLKRKLNQATINEFNLGFWPTGSRVITQLISYIQQHSFNAQDLVDANILMQSKQGLYSPYENRIIFPIRDHLGQTCGFGGRVFLPEDARAKYYNSSDSVFFKKSKLLFGLDIAKQEIHKKRAVFIVEGYMDCIALWQMGIKNAVATLGTACNTHHLQVLSKHAQMIYLLYDADQAGQQAVLRLISSCWELDLDLRVVSLPKGQDPADLLEKNMNLEPFLESSQDVFSFFLQYKASTFQGESTKYKVATIQELIVIIMQMKDSLKQNLLLIKAAESLQLPFDILKKEYNDRYVVPVKTVSSQVTKEENLALDKLEEQIIGALAYKHTILTQDDVTILTACLSDRAKDFVQNVFDHVAEEKGQCKHKLEDIVSQNDALQAARYMFSVQAETIEQVFKSLMGQFQKKYWKHLTQYLRQQVMLARQSSNIQEMQRLMTLFETLKADLYKNGR